MLKDEREKLNNINRERLVAKADCAELLVRVRRIKKMIRELGKEIKNLKNRKEQ